MNKAHIKLLKENYEKACEEILKAFCCQYELQYEKDAWVAGDVGTIALIGDYYIDFQDMMYMLNSNIAFDEWLRWYDYCLDAHDLGFNTPNFTSWCKGCPRHDFTKLNALKKDLNDAIKQELSKND